MDNAAAELPALRVVLGLYRGYAPGSGLSVPIPLGFSSLEPGGVAWQGTGLGLVQNSPEQSWAVGVGTAMSRRWNQSL